MNNFDKILKNSENNSLPLENPERLSLHHSFFGKIIYFKEKKKLDTQLNQQVTAFFQQRYGFNDSKTFSPVWNNLGAKIWTPKDILTSEIIQKIDQNFRSKLIYHGPGMIASPPSLSKQGIVQKLVQRLLHGGDFPLHLINKKAISAILISLDRTMMNEFFKELQGEIDQLAFNLPKTEQEEIVWRTFLGNILALLPYTYPCTGQSLNIPVLEEGNCRLVKYELEVIPLKYSTLSTPMTAIGMTPKEDSNASILAFSGTSFPAADGFVATVLADFTPGKSVGEHIYKQNKKEISNWLDGKKNIHVLGTSLGGALSLHTLRHHHQISRVDIYNSPGLYHNNWKKGMGDTCQLNIYCQPGDIVSNLGFWPSGKNVSMYTVFPHQKGVYHDPLNSHMRAFTGCEKISVIQESPTEKNKAFSRQFITKLHQLFAPVVFVSLITLVSTLKLATYVSHLSQYYFKKFRTDLIP